MHARPESLRKPMRSRLLAIAIGGFTLIGVGLTVNEVATLATEPHHQPTWELIAGALAAFFLAALFQVYRMHLQLDALQDERGATLWTVAHPIHAELTINARRVSNAMQAGKAWQPMAVLTADTWNNHSGELLKLGHGDPAIHKVWMDVSQAYRSFHRINLQIQDQAGMDVEGSIPPRDYAHGGTPDDPIWLEPFTDSIYALMALQGLVPELQRSVRGDLQEQVEAAKPPSRWRLRVRSALDRARHPRGA
jgi:hypothetical protein